MAYLTIGEVAHRAGIQPSAIRFYERIGVLPPPQRRNGRRLYEASVVQQLAAIRLISWAGFRMHEIKQILNAAPGGTLTSRQRQAMIAEKVAQMDDLMAQTQAMKAWLLAAHACQCSAISACITARFDADGMAIPPVDDVT